MLLRLLTVARHGNGCHVGAARGVEVGVRIGRRLVDGAQFAFVGSSTGAGGRWTGIQRWVVIQRRRVEQRMSLEKFQIRACIDDEVVRVHGHRAAGRGRIVVGEIVATARRL